VAAAHRLLTLPFDCELNATIVFASGRMFGERALAESHSLSFDHWRRLEA
jgi:hypothetical protein